MEFEGADPSVGILFGGWVCTSCDEFYEEDDQDYDFDGEFDD